MTKEKQKLACSDWTSFWQQMGTKLAGVIALCLTMRVLLAQEPAPAPATGQAPTEFKAPVGTDGNGFKYLATHPAFQKKVELQKAQERCKKVYQGQTPIAEDRSFFTNFYALYYFPSLTQTTDKELGALPDERQKFIKQQLEVSAKLPDPEVHNTLTSLALSTLTPVVRDNQFHPAVRYNGMLLISSLNDREAVRQVTGGAAPVPMARAL